MLTIDRPDAVVVPRRALVERNGGYAVFAIFSGSNGGTRVRYRPVEVGYAGTDEVEIVSGIESGERVVTFGQGLLKDGDLVNVVGGEGE